MLFSKHRNISAKEYEEIQSIQVFGSYNETGDSNILFHYNYNTTISNRIYIFNLCVLFPTAHFLHIGFDSRQLKTEILCLTFEFYWLTVFCMLCFRIGFKKYTKCRGQRIGGLNLLCGCPSESRRFFGAQNMVTGHLPFYVCKNVHTVHLFAKFNRLNTEVAGGLQCLVCI